MWKYRISQQLPLLEAIQLHKQLYQICKIQTNLKRKKKQMPREEKIRQTKGNRKI